MADHGPADYGGKARSYVYAIGRIEARYPTLSIEKEFAQVASNMDTAGRTDDEVLYDVLSQRENHHLARLLCWVFSIRDFETYILVPRDAVDIALLVDAIRPRPAPTDLDVVIGVQGPIAPPDVCNGLMVPFVAFSQIYSFDQESLIRAIPRPDSVDTDRFDAAASQVLGSVMQLVDNAGSTDEHRALNYLAMRYPEIYRRATDQYAAGFALSGVHVQRSPLGGARDVVDCIFTFIERRSGFTEKFAVPVDVTEEFLFLAGPLAPYVDRVSG